ncbi:Coenzyme F420 hydrogenase/dehydrogenase, beta subunit C-terminal domain [Vibrio cyclitrophicus]|uniref:Coenzyme F420 hydrogenase/dehydrogenase, beta subunit C-terminal domain n=1 Tax=Vibrio cyclitrophicus TaxID=47951 RepID=UPI000C81EF00|nr:Coenzyme F420 hydrogenase/dehydrogenase, beta subunit C-terminal domain [Vibrio cyclitrophicus]PMF46522.1 hypothetical protein BCV14_15290 [Vibrio cyclitrophicus]
MLQVKSIIKSDLCSGCGLCSTKDLKIRMNPEGYLRPTGNLNKEIPTGCPGYKLEHKETTSDFYDNLWGPVIDTHKGYSNNKELRNKGSSGGVITTLVKEAIETNIVDKAIVTTSDPSSPLNNKTVIVDSIQELIKTTGSRYSPSSPLDIIPKILGDKYKYVFVGKPCDVAALRQFVRKNQKYKDKFPLMFSFFCAGVPSHNASIELVEKLGGNPKDVTNLRYRGEGWPGLTRVSFKNASDLTCTYQESWGSILNKHLQKRCKLCADGTGEFADISCADVWDESVDGYPSFEEKDGYSLIITRTETGNEFLKNSAQINYEKYDIGKLKKVQPYQYERKSFVLIRNLALKSFFKRTVKYSGFSLFELTKKINIRILMIQYLSTVKRILNNRI